MKKWTLPEHERRLIEAVSAATSIAEVCRMLGLRPQGSNYRTIKLHVTRLGLDTSHHLGQAWSRGIPQKDQFRGPGSSSRPETLRKALIRDYGHSCWRCHLSTWQGKPITLELEHRDGNHQNNTLENLALLCCNCHALTDTWRGRNRSKAPLLQPAVDEEYPQRPTRRLEQLTLEAPR